MPDARSAGWGLPEGVRRVVRLGPHGAAVGRIAWSPDGKLVAVPTAVGNIAVWDVTTRQRTHELRGERVVYAVDFGSSGTTLASIGDSLTLWDLDSGSVKDSVARDGDDLSFVAGGAMLATAGRGHAPQLWTVGDRLEFAQLLDASSGDGSTVWSIAASADGALLGVAASEAPLQVWDVAAGAVTQSFEDETSAVCLAFGTDGVLASGGFDHAIRLRSTVDGRLLRTLEGHTDTVRDLTFLANGRLLASAGDQDSLWLWDSQSGEPLASFGGSTGSRAITGIWRHGLAAHPAEPTLACVVRGGGAHDVVDVMQLELDSLLGRSRVSSVTYASAKIVLVGDSGVGKTGLGWRLTHPSFVEHASTHGQQFWLLDELGTTRSDGAQCEAVLWDLAGQPDYRLIHALFLDDADLALLLFDPTRDDDPLRGVEYWLRQLGIGESRSPSERRPEAILVAARADRGAPRLANAEIERFCRQRGLRGFVTTSALDGSGLATLLGEMRDAIDWEARPTTVTTDTFKLIKNYVLGLKEGADGDRIIVSPDELHTLLETDGVAAGFSDDEMRSAVGHLSNHGYVTWLSTSEGDRRILLAPDMLNNVGASIVREARGNPKGLGSLEEHRVLAGDYGFAELQQLSDQDAEILLDAAVARFLYRNICFRETDPLTSRVYLVFPELINLRKPTIDEEQRVVEGVAYTASGSVENLYASLVVLLGYTGTFTRTNQWRDHARYVVGDGFVCGFRLEAERPGELDFVLYFAEKVGAPIRTLFQSLFESFVARRNLSIRRFEPVVCRNGHQLNRSAVREQVGKESAAMFCPDCGDRVPLPRVDERIVLNDEQAEELRDTRRQVAGRTPSSKRCFA